MANLAEFATGPQASEDERNEIASCSKQFLPSLFTLFSNASENSARDIIGHAIRTVIPLADEKTRSQYFAAIVKGILKDTGASEEMDVSQDAASAKAMMMDLVTFLLPVLDMKSVSFLYRVLKSQLQDPNYTMQKRSYKCLNLLAGNEAFVKVLQDDLKVVQALLRDSVTTTQAPAKAHRLRFIAHVVGLLDRSDLTFIPEMLPETMLAAKEAHVKARSAAYELLCKMGRKMSEGGQLSKPTSHGNGCRGCKSD